ncbi:MAG: DUF4492 domain-containing protein [Muribaculaceae bacterium]|nr:DUF4492 domain-containing protein [Muribaculaceae bacterium]
MISKITRIKDFYIDVWRRSVSTKTGRHLWLLLLLKVSILLVLFKILFFPNRLAEYETDVQKAEAVRQSMLNS